MTIKFSDKLTKQFIIMNAMKYHSIEAMEDIRRAFADEKKLEIKITKAISILEYILELQKERLK